MLPQRLFQPRPSHHYRHRFGPMHIAPVSNPLKRTFPKPLKRG